MENYAPLKNLCFRGNDGVFPISAQSPRGKGREGVVYWIVSQLQGGLRRLKSRLSFAGGLQNFHRLGDVFEGSAPHEIEMQMGDFIQRGFGVF